MRTQTATEWKGRDPLSWLLYPTTVDGFIDGAWERAPLIVRREASTYYDELLTFQDVNAFMSRNDIRYPYLRLVKNGRELPLIDYADDFVYGSNIFPGLLDNDKVFQHYADGATLSFQIFQKCMDGLSRFCNALEARLRFQTQVNIFVTPPNSKGFTAHYDDHSFFILQISGSKHWNIYGNPVELPLQEFRTKAATPELGDPQMRVSLNPGDMLYLPRGFYHEAHTTDQTSVHVTLGIFPYTWSQIIERQLSRLKQDLDFRRAPAEYLRSPDAGVALQQQFNALIAKLGGVEIESVFEELFVEAASKQIVDGQNRLRDLAQLQSVSPSSPIMRRNILCRVSTTSSTVKLSFYDKSITFPLVAKDAIEFILNADAFSIQEMPSIMDLPSNMVIVRKLLKEGLLTLSDGAQS